MKVTKLQLRKIIREEIRRLKEAKISPVYKKFANDISNIIKKYNPDGNEASFKKTNTLLQVMKYMKSKGWTIESKNDGYWKMKGGGIQAGSSYGVDGVEITDETNSSFFHIGYDGKVSGPHEPPSGQWEKIEKNNPDYDYGEYIKEFPSGWFI
jgi:hypothetical protein